MFLKYSHNLSKIKSSQTKKFFFQEVKECLIRKKVEFGRYNRWQRKKMNIFIKFIEEWRVVKFIISEAKDSRIIKEIANIRFLNLEQLRLSDNGIDSIESFNRIYFPCLSHLQFRILLMICRKKFNSLFEEFDEIKPLQFKVATDIRK